MAKRRAETTGELGARLAIFERKLAELDGLVNKVRGDIKNLESSYNDSRMNASELSRERHELSAKVDSYIKGGFSALTKAFVEEIWEERQRLAQVLRGDYAYRRED